jgi:hypothetical protein
LHLEERIESLYQFLKRLMLQEKQAEKQLQQLQALIHFCWMNYPLRFSDPELDELVLRHALPAMDAHKKNEQQEVYIASTLMEVGGHTRCLLNLIEHLPNKTHTVILTRQRKPLPEQVLRVFKANGVKCFILQSNKEIRLVASELQRAIESIQPTRVFLFHHADDLIPVLALANTTDIQSIYYNHSDHVFSVGTRFFSNSLEFRMIGAQLSKQVREIKNIGIHPLPVGKRSQIISKQKARQELDLPAGGYIVGTLTNPSKSKPLPGKQNMVDWMIDLASQFPKHFFLIVGLEQNQLIDWISSGKQMPENLQAVGIQKEAELYYRAMDFFLEPFPVGSGLGIIEAARYGAIPIFTPHDVQLCSTHEVFDKEVQALLKFSDSLENSTHVLTQYFIQPEQNINEFSRKLKNIIEQKHAGDHWIHGLELALNKQATIEHIDTDQIRMEALFFQEYQQKTEKEMLTYLLSSPHFSTRKHLIQLFKNHRYLFSLKNLSRSNIKRILLRIKPIAKQTH